MMQSTLYKSLDISGDTVLITGATAGIGRAIALRFGELGCKLVLAGRRTQRLEELKVELESLFPVLKEAARAPIVLTLDVTDAVALKELPEKLRKEYSVEVVDILVNNAGLALGVNTVDTNDIDDIQTMISTNVVAVMALVAAFSPGMKARGKGHILNISSVAGHECYGGGSVYSATKYAVNAFTICARHDLAGTPIRVTAVSPGLVQTEFSKVRFLGDDAKADKVYENIVPLCPDDIADQVVYAATRPRHVQVADIISYPTNQAHAKYVVERKGVEGLGPGGIDWRTESPSAKRSRI